MGAAMNSTSRARCEALRASLLALSEHCPYDDCNPADCPLFELRKMNPEERVKWFSALSEDDLVYLSTYHHVCLSMRIQSGQAEIGGMI
jgi:hypothetical protein